MPCASLLWSTSLDPASVPEAGLSAHPECGAALPYTAWVRGLFGNSELDRAQGLFSALCLLSVNLAMDRTDAKPGAAEIQMVLANGPIRGTHAEYIDTMRLLDIAHRTVTAAAGLQTGKFVQALVCFFENFFRNADHYAKPLPGFSHSELSSGRVY